MTEDKSGRNSAVGIEGNSIVDSIQLLLLASAAVKAGCSARFCDFPLRGSGKFVLEHSSALSLHLNQIRRAAFTSDQRVSSRTTEASLGAELETDVTAACMIVYSPQSSSPKTA